jgi:hypothetical protein
VSRGFIGWALHPVVPTSCLEKVPRAGLLLYAAVKGLKIEGVRETAGAKMKKDLAPDLMQHLYSRCATLTINRAVRPQRNSLLRGKEVCLIAPDLCDTGGLFNSMGEPSLVYPFFIRFLLSDTHAREQTSKHTHSHTRAPCKKAHTHTHMLTYT